MKRLAAMLAVGSRLLIGVLLLAPQIAPPVWAQLANGAAPAESISTHGYVIGNQSVKGSSIPAREENTA